MITFSQLGEIWHSKGVGFKWHIFFWGSSCSLSMNYGNIGRFRDRRRSLIKAMVVSDITTTGVRYCSAKLRPELCSRKVPVLKMVQERSFRDLPLHPISSALHLPVLQNFPSATLHIYNNNRSFYSYGIPNTLLHIVVASTCSGCHGLRAR